VSDQSSSIIDVPVAIESFSAACQLGALILVDA